MSLKMKGFDALLKKLNRLEKKGAQRANKKAVRAGTTVIAKAFRAEVPVDEGNLKKATSSKVYGRGMNAGGVVGADVAKLASDERRPTNIDHLVNSGHLTPEGIFVTPNRYRDRAEVKAAGPAMAAVERKLTQEIEKEASK